jgi:hypothetical protein
MLIRELDRGEPLEVLFSKISHDQPMRLTSVVVFTT